MVMFYHWGWVFSNMINEYKKYAEDFHIIPSVYPLNDCDVYQHWRPIHRNSIVYFEKMIVALHHPIEIHPLFHYIVQMVLSGIQYYSRLLIVQHIPGSRVNLFSLSNHTRSFQGHKKSVFLYKPRIRNTHECDVQ